MKYCPKCKNTFSDNFNFCTNCGTELETITICPQCGEQQKASAKFCTNCGTELENTTQLFQSSSETDTSIINEAEINIQNSNSEYETEDNESFFKKNKAVFVLLIICTIIVASIVFFSSNHFQTDANTEEIDTIDTVACDYEDITPKEIFEFESVETSPDIFYYEFISTVEGKKEPSEDAENDEVNYGDNPLTLEKGTTFWSYSSDAIDVEIKKISKDWSLYIIHGTGENTQWYIPTSSYKTTRYKQAKIPVSVLDNYQLIFHADNGNTLTFFKINRNNYTIKEEEGERVKDID
ncbi:MAG: zinc ribbon domain-containing protein, partial [Prevotellaceae bacterium]|nr:zinc ribbon domain-containing protein [Candidatus Colivivens equi]